MVVRIWRSASVVRLAVSRAVGVALSVVFFCPNIGCCGLRMIVSLSIDVMCERTLLPLNIDMRGANMRYKLALAALSLAWPHFACM